VEIILRQQNNQQLVEEVERLKTNASSDSRSSSKPPSSDSQAFRAASKGRAASKLGANLEDNQDTRKTREVDGWIAMKWFERVNVQELVGRY